MTEAYDAFTQGIDLGGMRTKNDIRILLCYILKSLDAPFSKSALNEVLQRTALVNFFEVNDALSALKESGLIASEDRENDEYYMLTPAGSEVSDRLETDLPLNVRRTAVAAAVDLLSREKARGGAQAQIEKLPKGYHIKMSVCEGDTLMMQTVLYAADSLQANSIAESFLRHPETLYASIVDAVTKDEE